MAARGKELAAIAVLMCLAATMTVVQGEDAIAGKVESSVDAASKAVNFLAPWLLLRP